jgi:hypothetical protein
MSRLQTQPDALSPGQLAKRWGLAVPRVRRLIESGQLAGAFKEPAASQDGEAIRIPMASIVPAEHEWVISPAELGQIDDQGHGS